MKKIIFLTYRERRLYIAVPCVCVFCCCCCCFILMPSIWKLSSTSNICTFCIPVYCCYLELLCFNPLNYNPFIQRVTDYISAIRCTADTWDQVSSVMIDFLIMAKNATLAKGKPSIPFLSFAPTCSSASICHKRYDHSLLGHSFLKYPSRKGEIQMKMPGFNHTEEVEKNAELFKSQLTTQIQKLLAVLYSWPSFWFSEGSWDSELIENFQVCLSEEADSVFSVTSLWNLVRNLLQCAWWADNLQLSFPFYVVDTSYKQGTRQEEDGQ